MNVGSACGGSKWRRDPLLCCFFCYRIKSNQIWKGNEGKCTLEV